jgi:RNA polymerase sigma-70 factor (ECF subfamily)
MQRQLVERAQSGDRAAFSALVTDILPKLLGTARLIIRDEELAKDAVQDAMVNAWLDLRTLRDPDRIEAWLYRLLIRACGRSIRGRSFRQLREVVLDLRDGPTVESSSALAERDQLERALRRLSPEHRTVLVVRYYLDLRLADCAQVMAIPLGTVQSRLTRAMAALRAELEADERGIGAVRESVA